ncbi:MAG: hypothetical protein R3C01_10185 [Planctomycetaceae bacterium]
MMTNTKLTSNILLVVLYSLVGMGALAIMRLHDAETVSTDRISESIDRSNDHDSLAEQRELPSGEASGRMQFGSTSRHNPMRLGGKPIAEASTPALVESEPSQNPEIAARQKAIKLGIGASLAGFRPFPDDNPWNQDISKAPVDPMSKVILGSVGLDKPLRNDFGAGTWEGAPIGIPYIVVSGSQPKVPVDFVAYGDQSDPGPYPIPPNAPIEGAPKEEADRHVLVVDRDNWMLYELAYSFPLAKGTRWKGDCGAIFDMKTNHTRPQGWTSADAAGLPIFPGLVRYDEVVEQKEIRHALRFTVAKTRRAYLPPATHWASKNNNPTLPPMGMRVRLRQDFDLTGYPEEAKVILTALKKYGMFLADNGSDFFINGAPDERWNNDALAAIRKVKGSDLEVIKMEGVVDDY